jgi:hypothetical protein
MLASVSIGQQIPYVLVSEIEAVRNFANGFTKGMTLDHLLGKHTGSLDNGSTAHLSRDNLDDAAA